MSLIQKGLQTALDSPVIDILAKNLGADNLVSILREHFTFSAFEIAQTYQTSYGYALAAISAGLAKDEQKNRFIQTLTHSNLSREFSEQINTHYLQPFAAQHGLDKDTLGQNLLKQINPLSDQPSIFHAPDRPFTETELAALVHEQGTVAITDLVLAQLQNQAPLDDTLAAFFRYDELLGNAILFFFREIIRKDQRAKITLETLQTAGLWADVRDIKTAQATLTTNLQEQLEAQKAAVKLAIDTADFGAASEIMQSLPRLQKTLDDIPQQLQAAQTAWQNSHKQLINFSQRFNTWAALLDEKVEQVLSAMNAFHTTLIKIDNNVEKLREELHQFMQRFDLSRQLKPRDEFTQHNSASRELIQAAVAKLKSVSTHHPDYNQLVIMAGSVLSSTGDMAEAESLFLQARNEAQNQADKALASFNLFQIRLRCQTYDKALADLQTAIDIDSQRYALHHVEKYPIQQILGAGGMGCVFLCHDQWGENQVVVKCFWEGRKGRRETVFKEAMLMRNLAGDYVPKPIDCDYTDTLRQERPYFVTEYIPQALDGEAWLAQHGKLDLRTGLAVGLQIAKGLQVAHKKGIYHLDLKPANLLLKQTQSGLTVKIIDFGLARVATSLKQQAVMTASRSDKSVFAQHIFGTLDYAPPEQLGETRYGEPGAKSDIFAFGATWYRLLSSESPRFPHPSELPNVPELQSLLLDCLKPHPEKRPDIDSVIARLSGLLKTQQLKPGDVFRDPLKESGLGPEMVVIPAGQFRMGDIQDTGGDDEKPVHDLSVKSFAMGRYPLTVGEFRQFVEATEYKAETGDGSYVVKEGKWQQVEDANWRNPYFPQEDDQPVVCISWNDAMVYIDWLTQQTGQAYCLPSEAQWEYAARAGTDTDYWWGNEIGKNRANSYKSGSQWSGKQTAPVGSFEPNPFGLYDTAGNVWEWCADGWHDNYEGAPTDGSVWEGDGSLFVLRGGSWFDVALWLRSSFRYRRPRTDRYLIFGVRLAMIL
ncbi:MAG: hypothetical protein DRQ99_13300 [Candidatus Parabeggiatoa sp. nov. 3]|nr:MAG: hypothetical protein DRQ99_13300 [Gammaproteobacteria bacterium]